MNVHLLAATDWMNNSTILKLVFFVSILFGIRQILWFYGIAQKNVGQNRHNGDIVSLVIMTLMLIAYVAIFVYWLLG